MKLPAALVALAFWVPTQAAQPNIVILYADDLGYGDLGCYNPDSKIPTPHLDKLAASGMRFTDGHSSSGICTPSRYALLTGRHHWRDFHGIVNALGKSVFKKDQLTLPQMLQEKGYATACIGKWHLGWDWDAIRKPGTPKKSIDHQHFDWSKPVPGGPLDHGFDHYFGDTVINFPPYAWIEDDKLVTAPNTTLRKPAAETKEGNWECRPGPAMDDWDFYQVLPTLTKKAVRYVEGRKGNTQPFFLFVPFPSPHAPIIPNDEFDGTSKAGPYGDFVHQTDDSCGRILKALEESGHADNTIVIFTADNGPEYYAFARDQKYDHWSPAPLRGLKRDIYEGGHHVPFLIRWPGLTKPGSVSPELISQVDFMATLAAAVGFELPDDSAHDSHDFLPYLRGNSETGPRDSMVHNTKKDHYAYRDGDWLLIDAKTGYLRQAPKEWNEKHNQPKDDGSAVELYNLAEDIGQKNNLATKHPERVAAMQKALSEDQKRGHTAPRLK
ncbi:sulfatase family protein [Haloferula rosea]|uniref:Arylsulfatase n=1 Tax=Haloferula rosea TaxID=490093 RepID=A0A934R9D9_9BACT|nr:arylsulfatase [Haloferula rosea]MBK1825613.1 arylsulfatase [Haloferula rosea]